MTSKIPPLFKPDPKVDAAKVAPPSSSSTAPKPSSTAQTAPAMSGKTATATAPSAAAPTLTAESLLQRLRYFENLVEQKDHYIAQLQAAVQRQGGAVPAAYFAPLIGAGGNYTPKGG